MDTIMCDSDFDEDVTITDDSDVAQDISGWTFEAECRRDCKIISLSTGGGIAIQDAANGVVRISLTAAQTKDFGTGEGRWLLWRTDSGMRKIIGEGSASFEGGRFDA
jgi:hypothetical protein